MAGRAAPMMSSARVRTISAIRSGRRVAADTDHGLLGGFADPVRPRTFVALGVVARRAGVLRPDADVHIEEVDQAAKPCEISSSMSSVSMPGRPSRPLTGIRVATAQSAPTASRTASSVSSQKRPRFSSVPP